MAKTITIVTRDDTTLTEDTTKHIYTYTSTSIPRVGEHIQISGHKPYVVERVINALSDGDDNIVVEVKTKERR